MTEEKKLYRLKELPDYEVADDNSDVRGWDVYSADNKAIAKVNELLVDLDAMRVRYLDILLNKDVRGDQANNHLLIPIGAARLDEKDNFVFVDYIETVTLLKIPQYDGGTVTRNYEKEVRKTFIPGTEEITADKFYEHDLYDDNKFYKSRNKNLLSLNETKLKEILRDNPDIRNADVIDSTGEKIGEVKDILYDSKTKRIRYLDIILEDDRLTPKIHKRIILPIGAAAFNENDNNVITNISKEKLLQFPLYTGGYVSRIYENSIRRHINSNKSSDKDFYEDEFYNSEKFYTHKM